MQILIIGGTGFISSLLLKTLHANGHNLTVLTRGKTALTEFPGRAVCYVQGDRRDPRVLQELSHTKRFDAVIDMIAYVPEESETAALAFRGKAGQFIHCSTISVYMISEKTQCPVAEDQWQQPVMPFDPFNPFGMEYGIKKRECEQVLWDLHHDTLFPVTALRPTFVSGPGDPTRRDYFWIQRILDGGPLLVPGSGEFKFQSVYVKDVVSAFVAALDNPSAMGNAYNVVGEEKFTIHDYLLELSKLLEKKPNIVTIPQEQFEKLDFARHPEGDVFPYNVGRDAFFSQDRIKTDLNFTSTPFREWMPETIDWFRDEYSGHSIGYERRADELRFIDNTKL